MSETSPSASATPSPSPSSATLSYLTRPGVDVSEMDNKQAEYMQKDRCILVNRKDEPIGSAAKQECHLNSVIRAGKGLHRAFSVFLFNSQGELLLQRRAKEKPTFPMRWTNTCCSHPLYGTGEAEEENAIGVKRAAIRKLEDELGITEVEEKDLVYLTRVHYCAMSDGKWGEHEIDHLMFCQKDVSVRPNPNEVSEIKYVSAAGLREEFTLAAKDPEHLTPWFQMISEKLLFGWWENGRLAEVLSAGGLGPVESQIIHELTLPDKPDTFIPKDTP